MATTLLHPFLYPRRLRRETEWFSHTGPSSRPATVWWVSIARPGKVQWTAHGPARAVFGLPGDMLLAYGETRAVAFAGKTGKEVFRVTLPSGMGSPELVDEGAFHRAPN
jgi:hypothetical protein